MASRFACWSFIAASRRSHCFVTSAGPFGVRLIGPIKASDDGVCGAAGAPPAAVISSVEAINSVNLRMIESPGIAAERSALLQGVQISIGAADIHNALFHRRRTHDGSNGNETVEIDVHVLEVAESRRHRLAIQASIRIQ